MSCGNRFQCGLSKATRFSFKPDKPSNPELHNENQKRLNDMLKAREEMDKGVFGSHSQQPQQPQQNNQIISVETNNNKYNWNTNESDNETLFTPWKVPSASVINPK